MFTIADATHTGKCPKPIEVTAYPDTIQGWVKTPLAPARQALIRRHCGTLIVENRPKRYQREYRQCLIAHQPRVEALHLLCEIDDLQLNRVALALDEIYDNADNKNKAQDFLDQHLIKKHHSQQGVRFFKNTRYTAAAWSPNQIKRYGDRHCRIDGQVHCLHIEWDCCGVKALERAGIATIASVLQLDHHEFWKPRLLLRGIELGRLGHLYNNRVLGQGRRKLWRQEFVPSIITDFDVRTGYALVRSVLVHSHSFWPEIEAQEVIDAYRSWLGVGDLVVIDNATLLPLARGYVIDRTGVSQTQVVCPLYHSNV